MNNDDKNTIPFVQFSDRKYIKKLKTIDASLNKSIDELIDVQVENSTTIANGLSNTIAAMLRDRIDAISGVYKTDEGYGDIGFTTTAPIETLSGQFNINMRSTSSGYGDLPATSFIYDIGLGIVTDVYQRYNIAGLEYYADDYTIGAIDGDYAICLAPFSGVVITPYRKNTLIKTSSDWASTSTVTVGTDTTRIAVLSDSKIADVIMIRPGAFIINSFPYFDSGTSFIIQIVTYTTMLDPTTVNLTIDLISLGFTGYGFVNQNQLEFGVDDSSLECSVAFMIRGGYLSGLPDKNVSIRFNYETGAIITQVESLSPLASLSAITIRSLQFSQSEPYYRYVAAAYGTHLIGSDGGYGHHFNLWTYSSREVTEAYADGQFTHYIGTSSDTEIETVPLISAKMTALGHSPSGIYLDQISVFIS